MDDRKRGLLITVFAAIGLISSGSAIFLHYQGKNEMEGVGNFWGMAALSLVILVMGIRILIKSKEK